MAKNDYHPGHSSDTVRTFQIQFGHSDMNPYKGHMPVRTGGHTPDTVRTFQGASPDGTPAPKGRSGDAYLTDALPQAESIESRESPRLSREGTSGHAVA